MDLRFVYMTTRDRAQAEAIGQHLVQNRLAACVNILDGMQSMYWWDGAVQKDSETVLIAKTRAEHLDRLKTAVCELHSYDVPCIVALPIVDGLESYLNWVTSETKSN